MKRNQWLSVHLLVCFFGISGFVYAELNESCLFWTTVFGKSIQKVNLDTMEVSTVLSGLDVTCDIALDPYGEKIYWTERQGEGIFRANSDGTHIEHLLGPGTGTLSSINNISLDTVNHKLYWTDFNNTQTRVCRSNLDGSSVQVLVSSYTSLHYRAISVDTIHEKLYWSENGSQTQAGIIRRSNLDGSEKELLRNVGTCTFGLKVDVQNEKLYWTNNNEHQVWRMNVDGSMAELLHEGSLNPLGLALDLNNNQVYWADHHAGLIYRGNLDGSGQHVFLTADPYRVEGLALYTVPEPGTIVLLGLGALALRRKK